MIHPILVMSEALQTVKYVLTLKAIKQIQLKKA